MAVGDFLTWSVQAQDAPAHAGRFLQTILLNEGVVDVAGGSFETTEDTGSNMNITIGSGTLGDLAVIEGDDTAGQGVYVIEAQNATVTKTIAASDPSDDRIDLVVLQNYDDEADSSGNNDAEVEVIEGTPAASPSAPSLPDSAIPLAEVLVGAGVTAITNANITDLRENAKSGGAAPGGQLGYAQTTTNQTGITTEVDLTNLTVSVDVPANRRIRITGYVLWSQDTVDEGIRLFIKDDTTFLARGDGVTPATGGLVALTVTRVLTPSNGSHTYKLAAQRLSGGTVTIHGLTSEPNVAIPYILVEDLGPA